MRISAKEVPLHNWCNNLRRLSWVGRYFLSIIIFSNLFSTQIYAQTATFTIHIKVVGKTIGGRPVWVIDPFPTDADVQSNDPNITAKAQEILRDTQKNIREAARIPQNVDVQWILTPRFPTSFGASLHRQNPNVTQTVTSAELNKNPVNGQTAEGTVTFSITITAMEKLKITAVTAAAADSTKALPVETYTLPEIVKALGAKIGDLSTAQQSTQIVLRYSDDDLKDDSGKYFEGSQNTAREKVRLELKSAALNGFITARNHGLTPGKILPQGGSASLSSLGQELNDVTSEIKHLYLEKIPLPKFTGPSTDWSLEIDGLVILGGVDIKVLPPSPAATKLQNALDKRVANVLLAETGIILTTDIVTSDIARLNQPRDVETAVADVIGETLTYNVNRRKTVKSLILQGVLGYSAEQGMTGTASLSAVNLLDLDDTMSFTYTGGDEVQKAVYSYSIPFDKYKKQKRPEERWEWNGLNFTAQYYKDRNQRLGNTTGPKLEDQESKGSVSTSWSFDSFNPKNYIEQAQGINDKRVRAHYKLDLSAAADYAGVDINARTSTPTTVVNGQEASYSISASPSLNYDNRRYLQDRGIGEINVAFTFKYKQGLSILGAEFPYKQLTADFAATIFFGTSSTKEMFFRYERGYGLTSIDTPIFREFRLGGSNNVRGIEEGEFIGRRLAFERIELGRNLNFLKSLFGRKKSTADGNTGGAAPGLDLSNFYIKGLFDRGFTADAATLGHVLSLSPGAVGYGIAVEIRKMKIGTKFASLTIGYARSPQSILHHSGVLVTGISLNY